MNYKEIVKEVLLTEAKELEIASSSISFDIENIVNLIINSKGKLIVTGVGKSGLVGAKIAATLASTGTSSFFLHPTEAMHGDLGMIGKEDIVLAISYSGESEELIQILPHIKRFNIPLIAMAKDEKSTLAKYENELSFEINFHKYMQFQFFKQWLALKKYANENNIKIIGDIPIFVSLDSWAISDFPI